MNVVARKLSLICVVVFCAALCSGDVLEFNQGDACIVPYLKASGKLNADFPIITLPQNPLVCYVYKERLMNIVKSSLNSEIEAEMPNNADCLTEQFDMRKSVENVFAIRLIEKSDMNDTDKQLFEARNDFADLLRKISEHCGVDKEKFINIFQMILGIKNETLEAYQTVYCLAKYAAENKLLDTADVEINPHNIDTESINCDGIVEVEKSKAEREIRSVIFAMPSSTKILDCVMDGYKNSETFRFQIALKVLYHLDFPKETKESAAISNGTGFRDFLQTSSSTCAESTKS